MKQQRRSASKRFRVPFARVTAFFLLAGIIYSATFATVHSHSVEQFVAKATISADSDGQTTVSETPIRRSLNDGECLVCALHRDFSNGVIYAPIFVAAPNEEVAFSSTPVVSYNFDSIFSRPASRMSGRAPPLHPV
jgi:hypothetical protein